ncbi:MAG: protein BatD [Chromatiales bacterium]|nr:protein BatD [Chromatiales bacterium]
MRVLLATLFLLLSPALAALEAQVDRTQLARNETLQLVIELTEQDGDGEPDLSPLHQDFEIINSSQSQQIQIISGLRSASRRVIVNLSPKREGTLIIPALKLGNASTAPIAIQITEERLASAAAGSDVFLEVEIDESKPYVQAQVVYTVRVHTAVNLEDAGLSDIEVDDLLVQRLGDDLRYRSQVGGRTYHVIERRYALFAQSSGSIEIPPMRLTAQVPDKRRNRDFNTSPFGADPFQRMFGATKPISVASRSIHLQVQPRPADAPPGPWLPARAVALKEDWAPEPPVFRVGEPVTRSLTLTARGLTASQLPELNADVGAHFKVYPDQPNTETTTQGVFVLGRRVEKQALIPTQAGTVTLPSLELNWWNTAENRIETAMIASRQVEVLPAALTGQSPLAATPEPLQPSLPAETTNAPTAASPTEFWPWVSAALAGLWMLTLWAWWRSKHIDSPEKRRPADHRSASLRDIGNACRNGDPASTRTALLNWARQRWPNDPPEGPQAIAQRLQNPAVVEQLMEMERHLYRGEPQAAWDGKACWSALKSALAADNNGKPPEEALPPLYPAR